MKQDDLNNSTVDLDVAEEADNQFAPAMEIEDADAEKVAGGAKRIPNCKPVVT